jgi:hypothetical protein
VAIVGDSISFRSVETGKAEKTIPVENPADLDAAITKARKTLGVRDLGVEGPTSPDGRYTLILVPKGPRVQIRVLRGERQAVLRTLDARGGEDGPVRRAFSLYDEAALGLRRATGLGYREILLGMQLVFRALGLAGIFLIVSSFGLGTRMSLAATAMFALGATIWGPTVLTIEYEPIPRAFALPLILLAIGLEARGWPLAAGSAAAAAFLFHGTTTFPYWICCFLLVLWPAERSVRRRRLLGLLPLAAVAAVLGALSLAQPGRAQPLFNLEALPAWWEQVLRLRSTYVCLSMWAPRWYWHYAILAAVCAAGLWRLRRLANADLGFFLAGLPALGVLSLPFSYLMLEVGKSSLAPQLQPMRTILFVTAVASLLALAAGIRAAQSSRWAEAVAWLLVPAIVPAGNAVQDFLWPDLTGFLMVRRVLLAV